MVINTIHALHNASLTFITLQFLSRSGPRTTLASRRVVEFLRAHRPHLSTAEQQLHGQELYEQ